MRVGRPAFARLCHGGRADADGHFSFGLTGQRASDGYRDVASLYGAPLPLLMASGNIAYNTQAIGSVGINYADLRYPQEPASRFGSRSNHKLRTPGDSENFTHRWLV